MDAAALFAATAVARRLGAASRVAAWLSESRVRRGDAVRQAFLPAWQTGESAPRQRLAGIGSAESQPESGVRR
jgi:hypothetical protein